jgi:nucleotide-binding universal stress UspA family protein
LIAIQRILCPIDFSEFSKPAVEQAVALARWYEAGVDLLHVAAIELPPAVFEAMPGPLALDARSIETLEAEIRELSKPWMGGDVPVQTLVRVGKPAQQIVETARISKADLVVIGTHGRSGFERLMLGSTADKVLRKAPCPVMTVPRQLTDGTPRVLFKQIVCATDFSAGSGAALAYGLSLAQEADARLTIVHVLDWPDVPSAGDPFAATLRMGRMQLETELRARLRETVPADARTWCDPEEVLVTGTPYREILRTAGETGADLIVMGVQGRGALDLGLFGSTTSEVLRRATCPVLTVRTP